MLDITIHKTLKVPELVHQFGIVLGNFFFQNSGYDLPPIQHVLVLPWHCHGVFGEFQMEMGLWDFLH